MAACAAGATSSAPRALPALRNLKPPSWPYEAIVACACDSWALSSSTELGRAEETADGVALMFSLALAFDTAGSAGCGELSALSCDLESETDLLPVASERGADR
jgi:hypothetical protein